MLSYIDSAKYAKTRWRPVHIYVWERASTKGFSRKVKVCALGHMPIRSPGYDGPTLGNTEGIGALCPDWRCMRIVGPG